MEPLGLSVENNEDVIRRDSCKHDGKANPCVEWIRVEREEDHEEAGEGENCWDEDRDLRGKKTRSRRRLGTAQDININDNS